MAIFNDKETRTTSALKALLEKSWDESLVNGGILDSSFQLVRRYEELAKVKGVEVATKRMLNGEANQGAIQGAIGSLGGFVTAAICLPTTFILTTFMQVRLAAAVALMGELDLNNIRVKAKVFASLATNKVTDEIFKNTELSDEEVMERVVDAVVRKLVNNCGWKVLGSTVRTVPLAGFIVGGIVDHNLISGTGKRAMKRMIP